MNATSLCPKCGESLSDDYGDAPDSLCFACRKPTGKLCDLLIAIESSGDSPERLEAWRSIRPRLRESFDYPAAGWEERFQDWLHVAHGIDWETALGMPLHETIGLLEAGPAPTPATAATEPPKAPAVSGLGERWTYKMLEAPVAYYVGQHRDDDHIPDRQIQRWVCNNYRGVTPSLKTIQKTKAYQDARNTGQHSPRARVVSEANSGIPIKEQTTVSAGDINAAEIIQDALIDLEDRIGRKLTEREREEAFWEFQLVLSPDDDGGMEVPKEDFGKAIRRYQRRKQGAH